MTSPFCLPVPPNKFEPDFYKIQQRGHAIEGDLNSIIFNPLASTIPKWQTFKLLRWTQNLHHSMCNHGVLYVVRSTKDEHFFNKTISVNTQKYEHGEQAESHNSCFVLWKKIHEPLHLQKRSSLNGHTCKFYVNHYFVCQSF
jgi:hypothetical protein